MKNTDLRKAEAEYQDPESCTWVKHGLYVGKGISPILGKKVNASHTKPSRGLKEVSTPKRR